MIYRTKNYMFYLRNLNSYLTIMFRYTWDSEAIMNLFGWVAKYVHILCFVPVKMNNWITLILKAFTVWRKWRNIWIPSDKWSGEVMMYNLDVVIPSLQWQPIKPRCNTEILLYLHQTPALIAFSSSWQVILIKLNWRSILGHWM